MTPRKISANRANARRSTGPRTEEGKRHMMLNGLRHGGFSQDFRANLIRAGYDVELFDWIHERVREEMLTASPRVAELVARRVWCGLCLHRRTDQRPSEPPPTQASLWCLAWTPWRAGGLATKPRYAVKPFGRRTRRLCPGFRFWIEDPSSRRRLLFWVPRRRGTVVRLPVTAWPEIAAWERMRTRSLQAGPESHDVL
jgi:hypothetical protein